MKFLFESDTWKEIYESIRKNKLRTIVTIIGVTWGIFLLVSLLGAARGMENSFNRLFGDLATNSVFIWRTKTSMPFKGYQEGRRVEIKRADIQKIKNEIDGIEFIVPRYYRNGTITKNFESAIFSVYGDYPLLNKVQKKNLSYGRFINEIDIQEKRKVVVISEEVYKQLFDKDVKAVGENILINKINFTVIGVFKSGQFDDENSVHIPFTTLQRMYNTGDTVGWVMVTAKKDADINQIEIDTKLLLKNLCKVHPNDPRGFGSFNLGKEFAKMMGFLKGMQFLTWFVGIATLIAGVFAIGNILLITVKERTQEIGIRRALGATPIVIKRQIILEAVTLSLIAGILGIISGGLVLILIDTLYGQGDDAVLVNASVSIPIVLIAVLALTILGTLIGLIPASRATRIKPIEALSDE
ncbi:ABC transporter permease [Flavicella marina]|uniref:ABC transporter permease n=1 Tax=Flavicella marina TaxID=1475951 RepID=UPI001264E055|nr:ABC transporter permease [Flavicella marina]